MSDASSDASDASQLDGVGPPDSANAGCLLGPLGGVGVPAGTVVSASSTYSTFVSAAAIDGDLSTLWNASGNTASLELQFPTPQSIIGLRMAATASPATNETYTITASGGSTTIGSGTEVVGSGTYTIEPTIAITPGTYAGIVINVNGGSSWAAINEVSLLTAGCPDRASGDGGSGAVVTLTCGSLCPAGAHCEYTANEVVACAVGCTAAFIATASATYAPNCNPVSCPAAVSTCAGSATCSVTFDNPTCGGDPCTNVHKTGLIALACTP